MSWRTVVITERAKLDMRMGHIVVRSDEKTLRINIDEVSVLIIENPAVSITGCLISALSEKKIKVIFCGLDHNPVSELVPYYGSHDTSAKIKKQINWDEGVRSLVWTQIVAEKIQKQAELLFEKGCYDEAELLRSYINEIEIGDMTNREGHAAKVYFNAIFGMGFTRNRECTTNAALNYGYSIILSCFNREITSNGYLTQLGLFHSNMFNQFNLSCDLMEPFRIMVDRCVVKNGFTKFEKDEKHILVNVLNSTVVINNSEQYLGNAIKIYCKSVFDSLNDNNVSEIQFYHIKNDSEKR